MISSSLASYPVKYFHACQTKARKTTVSASKSMGLSIKAVCIHLILYSTKIMLPCFFAWLMPWYFRKASLIKCRKQMQKKKKKTLVLWKFKNTIQQSMINKEKFYLIFLWNVSRLHFWFPSYMASTYYYDTIFWVLLASYNSILWLIYWSQWEIYEFLQNFHLFISFIEQDLFIVPCKPGEERRELEKRRKEKKNDIRQTKALTG